MFVEDDAPFSIPTFMKEKGDDDIQVSKWNIDDIAVAGNPLEVAKSRVIEYTHPVNAPMAPPMARARKEQSYRKYSNQGLVVETKTYVSDVPMTDCFYVADLLRVEPSGDNDGVGTVKLSMQFDIRFVKSTIFKGIISKTTKKEFESFMRSLAEFMATNLGKADVSMVHPETIPHPSTEDQVQQTTVLPPTNAIIYLLLWTILLLQCWILIDLRGIKDELYSLRQGECPFSYKSDEIITATTGIGTLEQKWSEIILEGTSSKSTVAVKVRNSGN